MSATIKSALRMLLFIIPGSVAMPASSVLFNSIRIVQVPFYSINDHLLDRIKASEYNYVVVGFPFRTSNETIGDGDVYENLRNDVRNVCITLNQKKLKLIPLIPMSSIWALQWKTLQLYENPDIGMNTMTTNDDLPVVLTLLNPVCDYKNNIESVNRGSNSWAKEPNGVDKSVIDLFNAVRDGFSDAGLEPEYVHIQHDEPQFLNWSLMAGAGSECQSVYPYRGNFARGEVSKSDVNYISTALSGGYTVTQAYQRLLADEIYRRVMQADKVYGPKVRLMFYADAFDNQSWGGVPWWVNFGDGSQILMHGVIDLPGLDESQKLRVREQTIPILWNYDGKIPAVKGAIGWLDQTDYNSDDALFRFASRGFRFMYVGALQSGDNSKKQITEYFTSSKKYPDNCLGFYAAVWDAGYDSASPDKKWDIIEYMKTTASLPTSSGGSSRALRQHYAVSMNATSGTGIGITVFLAKSEPLSIDIFTAAGRKTVFFEDTHPACGICHYTWSLRQGLYLVRMRVGGKSISKSVAVAGMRQ